jgi:putative ABC transport system permease protein
MIAFIFKGLWRDKSRSRLPIMVVSLGVMLTVLMHAYIQGFMGDAIEINARFNHGHMKVMTAAYAENAHQMPIDLALTGSDEIMSFLEREYPGLTWSERITFGGLVDIPDAQGETQSQGPVMGMGMRLLGERKDEVVKHGLASSIARGAMPQKAGEVLISDAFALRLGLEPGDTMTLLGSTMYGSMSFHNFILSGTLVFGVEALDRGSMIADLEDVRAALDMENASSEILGFFHTGFYDDDQARKLSAGFVPPPGSGDGEFSPVMHALSQQGHMGQYVNMSKVWSGYVSLIFIMACRWFYGMQDCWEVYVDMGR